MKKSDKEIVILLTQNDQEAFREIYLSYKDKLWHYCFSLIKSEDETNDIVQEVFIRLWELRGGIDPELSLSSLLYTMVRYKVLNHFRNMDVESKVKKLLSQKPSIEIENTESDLIFYEYQHLLKNAIEQLPTQRKRIYTMSRIDHKSHKEIALQLSISIYTVQEHISESLRFIKSYFKKYTDLKL